MKSWDDIAFIDIAVTDGVRENLRAGQGIVIADAETGALRWINGIAAEIASIDSIGAQGARDLAVENASLLRQLRSCLPLRDGASANVMLRLQRGIRTHLIRAEVKPSEIVVGGRPHVIVVMDIAGQMESQARHAVIAGLSGTETAAGILSATGEIVHREGAAALLNLDQKTLASLADETAGESDRLVKRMARTSEGLSVALGCGRLNDDPLEFMLIVLDASDEIEPEDEAEVAIEEPAIPSAPVYEEPEAAQPVATAALDEAPEDTTEHLPMIGDHADTDFDYGPEDMDGLPGQHVPDFSTGPIRFVWKSNRDGIFTEISPEFARAVGPGNAQIVGLTFGEIAARYKLDPGGEIEASLERHDTWSGKSVLWPVQDTDLRVPVDLAALPFYDRDRNFEGYRGFGIVRMGDTIVDPGLIDGADVETMPESDAAPLSDSFEENPSVDIHDEPVTSSGDDDDSKHDPFDGEPPVIHSATITPFRRRDDGVATPAQSEAAKTEIKRHSLSDSETAAFNRIRDALKPSSDETEDEDDTSQPPLDIDGAETVVDSEDTINDEYDSVDGNTDAEEEPVVFGRRAQPPVTETGLDVRGEDDASESGLGSAIFDDLPLAIMVVRDGQPIFINEAFSALTGYENLDHLAEMDLDAFFVDQAQADADSAMAVLGADGDEIAVHSHLRAVDWVDGSAMLFAFEPVHGEQNDLTDDDQDTFDEDASDEDAESARLPYQNDDMAEQIEELRAILDTATDGVIVLSGDGTIRSINGAAAALFGYSGVDVRGKSFSMLFAHESQRAAMDYLYSLAGNGVASLLNEGREVLGRERNGGLVPLFMTLGRLPGNNGFCAVLRDITAWKQTEQQLLDARRAAEDASRTKSDFLAKISHEIRTPLNAIIGFSEIMVAESFGPVGNERYRGYAGDINKSGRHVLELVNDLLDISKIESGKQDLDFESVKLAEPLSEAVTMLQPQANRNRVIIRSSFDGDVPPVVADLRSIKQIALNLLSNAIRFTNDGGQVIVSTKYTPEGTVVLRIRDTGVGMTAKELESALQPFKQIVTPGRTNEGGTGLGLPLTKALVEANRAEFSISSEPGHGTVVEIIFPSTRVLAD